MMNYLTVKEVMAILKISRMTAYKLIWDGKLKSRRVGRLVRVSSQDLGRFMQGPPYQRAKRVSKNGKSNQGNPRADS